MVTSFPSLGRRRSFVRRAVVGSFATRRGFTVGRRGKFGRTVQLHGRTLSRGVSTFSDLCDSLRCYVDRDGKRVGISSQLSPIDSVAINSTVGGVDDSLSVVYRHMSRLVSSRS